ncbi:unnamed protein product, partial [Vitis vinifera]
MWMIGVGMDRRQSFLQHVGNEADDMERSSDHSSSGPSKIPYVSIPKAVGSGAWGMRPGSDGYNASNDATLFSCSLPVLPHEKLNLNDTEHCCQSIDDAGLDKLQQDVEAGESLEDDGIHAIGSLLPDDEDELLAGIMDDFDLSGLSNPMEDVEEYDLFGSGGGMELEIDPQESLNMGMAKVSLSDGVVGNGLAQYGLPNGSGTVAGEHPYGEHPSRTLFVRNINSNVEDSELRTLFEQYGAIRTLYTACKHRGFVMISYYDIRAARTAMRALQNKPLRRRKLDIHFSIPKDNPSDKDVNQGTLVVFNLDPSVSNDDLRQIFGAYGEVKEIRETPHKRHHKFIEFYDVRAAEAALRSLNRSDIAGKRIKLEPSRPGGARRNLMLQLNQELEQDESRSFRHHVGSPMANSPPGSWAQFSSPIEHSPLQSLSKSPGFRTVSPTTSNHLPGLASILNSQISNSVKVAPIGKDQGRAKFGPISCPAPYSEHTNSSAWQPPSMGHPFASNGQGRGFPYSGRHERHFGYFPESPEASFMTPVAFGGMGLAHNDGTNMSESGSANFRMISSPRLSPMFPGNGPFPGLAPSNIEGLADRGRSRWVENNGNQIDSKKQFQLDLDKILNGEDTRTTLMIKNIPNKYTSKMLLAAIDEYHRGTYDFLYLPIDFKNKCNVGYAFINMLSPSHIIPFYQAFNGKKWEKFNSEKVASLAYARIQGKAALVTHFQNSSLMNEDKRCRPILFHSEGPEAGDQIIQEHLPSNSLNIQVPQPNGSQIGDTPESPEMVLLCEKPEKS